MKVILLLFLNRHTFDNASWLDGDDVHQLESSSIKELPKLRLSTLKAARQHHHIDIPHFPRRWFITMWDNRVHQD